SQVAQLHRAEPGSDPSGIAQPAGRIIIADEKGAETLAAALGVGKTENDEFVAIAALDLEPGTASSRTIGRVPALRHDSFEAKAARLAKNGRTVSGLVIAVAQDPRRLQRIDLAQRRFAVFQGGAGEVPAIAIEQIEGKEIQRAGLAGGNRILQVGKA